LLSSVQSVSGFVLAGGQSSRMGHDKALMELAGKPLIEHAVAKLKRVCSDVAISSGNPLLSAYAPLVADLHPGYGPIGGIEAALLGTRHEWNLFIPVDVPFLPTLYLYAWLQVVQKARPEGMYAMIFAVNGQPQPTVALLHREIRPGISRAMEQGEHRLFRTFELATRELAEENGFTRATRSFGIFPYWSELNSSPEHPSEGPAWWSITEAQRRYNAHWFDILNTPDEFAEAERRVDALDT